MFVPPIREIKPTSVEPLPEEILCPRWYAVQTAANQERKVSMRLRDKDIESFLPEYLETRKRTDRKVIIHVPLFTGYAFVHIGLRDRHHVLQVPGVVRIVGFHHFPAAVADDEIQLLQAGMEHRRLLPHPHLPIGRSVRVLSGPFAGLEGILLRRKAALRVVVAIQAIARCFSIEVSELDLDRQISKLGPEPPKSICTTRTELWSRAS